MIVFFGIAAGVGVTLILLDFAAMANDVTPSLYRTGLTQFGLLLVVVSAIGALCVWAFG